MGVGYAPVRPVVVDDEAKALERLVRKAREVYREYRTKPDRVKWELDDPLNSACIELVFGLAKVPIKRPAA